MAATTKLSQYRFFSFLPSYSTRFCVLFFTCVFLKRFYNYLTTENCNLVAGANGAEEGKENNCCCCEGVCERRWRSKENSCLFPSSCHKFYRNMYVSVWVLVRHTSNKSDVHLTASGTIWQWAERLIEVDINKMLFTIYVYCVGWCKKEKATADYTAFISIVSVPFWIVYLNAGFSYGTPIHEIGVHNEVVYKEPKWA